MFQVLVEAALRDAAAGAFDDEDEDEGTGEDGRGDKTQCIQIQCMKVHAACNPGTSRLCTQRRHCCRKGEVMRVVMRALL